MSHRIGDTVCARALLRLVRALVLYCACLGCAAARVAGAGAHGLGSTEADRYEITETPAAVLGSGQTQALDQALEQAAREAGLALRGDGRLALLARQLAGQPSLDPEIVASWARARGLVDADLALYVVRAPSAELLAAVLRSELATALRARSPTHFGVFVHPLGRSASILLGRRPPFLDPVPRELPTGATIHIRGRLAATHQNPKLTVSGPSGSSVLPAGVGPAFDLRVPARRPGVYRLELQAREAERVRALIQLDVYVGVSPHGVSPSAGLGSAAQTTRQLRDALYAHTATLRADHGLPALIIDARLELDAERYSQQLAAAGSAATVPENRLGAGLTLRTVVRGRDQPALWTGLLADGALRAKLDSADVTHVGIGIARKGSELVVTHLLAHLLPAVDADLAPSSVLAALNENRRARAVAALRPDPILTRVARRAAQELAARGGRDEREIIAQANAELEHHGLAYGRVAAVAALVRDPLEAATLEPALDAEAFAAGIAVAQVQGGTTVAVVIALGLQR